MVDCGLLQVIEIRRVVDVTEGINLMEPDRKIGLERRAPASGTEPGSALMQRCPRASFGSDVES